MRKFAILLVPFVFIMSACGVNVTAGDITDKSMKDAWSEEVEITEQECETETKTKMVNGKSQTYLDTDCETVGTGEFETVDHPAEYTFELTDKDGNTDNVSVDEETYNSYDLGDFYDTEEK